MSDGREKKTLALFAAIMLFGFSCICAYVFFGHNWNFAVSQFDDTFGDMESYTVILYEGTIEVPEEETQGFELVQGGPLIPMSSSKKDAESVSSDTNQSQSTAAVSEASQGSAQNTALDASTDSQTESKPSLASRIARKLSSIFNLNTDTEASEEESEDVIDDSIVTEEIDVSSIDKAVESYEQKNAIAFVLDTSNLARYQDGLILENGRKRIAVFSSTSIQSLMSLQNKVDYLKSMNVSMTIAMVDDVSRIAGVSGIDMVVRCSKEEPEEWSTSSKGRYMALAPAKGSVAATIISPSNIVVTRVF